MALGIQQAVIIVLTVQLDQMIRELAQHFARTAPIIDPRRLAPVLRVHPAQHQFVATRQPGLFEDHMGGMAARQIEFRDNLATFGPCPHQFCATAPAQHKAQGIQQDRLARAGFTGQHIQPGLKIQLQPVDDQHVPNFQRPQHQPTRITFRRRLQPLALDRLTINARQPTVAPCSGF